MMKKNRKVFINKWEINVEFEEKHPHIKKTLLVSTGR